jgi:hypothetical protein
VALRQAHRGVQPLADDVLRQRTSRERSSAPPLPPDPEAWLARLDAATEYLGRGRARAVRERLLRLAPGGPTGDAAENRDLDPRDEFAAPGR